MLGLNLVVEQRTDDLLDPHRVGTGALLAHGTENDAKGVAAMVPGLEVAHVTSAMRALEATAVSDWAIAASAGDTARRVAAEVPRMIWRTR